MNLLWGIVVIDLNSYVKVRDVFFEGDTLDVCDKLIGGLIKCEVGGEPVVAKISEIEAYLGAEDRASHAYGNRKTERTKPIFLPGGHSYISFVYGMHYNFNFVTCREGVPETILLRGIEILEGYDTIAQKRYGTSYDNLTKYQKKNLTNGPGKVCQALGLSKQQNAKIISSLFDVYIPEFKVNYKLTPRIGVDYAGEDKDLLYRFLLD